MHDPSANSPATPSPALQQLLCAQVAALCEAAGRAILVHYADHAAGRLEIAAKDDGSPLTAADEAAHALLVEGLAALSGDYGIVSEEDEGGAHLAFDRGTTARPYWLVDPLDGTKEFVSRNGQFTVNVALVVAGRPVLGVVHVPVTGDTYAGVVGGGATWVGPVVPGDAARAARPLRVRAVPPAGLNVVGSRSHGDAAAMDAFLAGRRVAQFTAAGSSLKFCLLARGEADLYPRLGPTMIWDTAAGQAVLEAAGGQVLRLDGTPLDCTGELRNPHFVAIGDAAAWAAR